MELRLQSFDGAMSSLVTCRLGCANGSTYFSGGVLTASIERVEARNPLKDERSKTRDLWFPQLISIENYLRNLEIYRFLNVKSSFSNLSSFSSFYYNT